MKWIISISPGGNDRYKILGLTLYKRRKLADFSMVDKIPTGQVSINQTAFLGQLLLRSHRRKAMLYFSVAGIRIRSCFIAHSCLNVTNSLLAKSDSSL